jgi:hypothetical protein
VHMRAEVNDVQTLLGPRVSAPAERTATAS